MKEPRRQVKPFAQLLQEQRGGALHAELSEELAAVVQAARATGKDGKLALTITVHPNDDGATMSVTDQVKATRPEVRGAALFYDSTEGNLSRRNPNQPELPLHDASAPGDTTDEDDEEATG